MKLRAAPREVARYSYRTGTLTLPTLEDAPETLRIWLPQRTRWYKGWTHTWLVHMRSPGQFLEQVGGRSFLVAQVLSVGLVASSLTHPLLVLTILYVTGKLLLGGTLSVWQSGLLLLDSVNITLGYTAFVLLGWQNMKPAERKGFWRIVLFTPIYWLLLSWAAWRAVFQLWRRPHLWEKTPHFRARDVAADHAEVSSSSQ